MKKSFLFAVLTFFCLAFLQGCATTDTADSGAPVEGQDTSAASPTDTTDVQPGSLTDPNSLLSKRSVYFALDRYDIAEEYRNLIYAHGNFLNANRQLKVLIQGNTDERGSHEYNLALGQKRAEAVRQMLLLLGVQEGQVEAVSLGEEKPRAEGHDEAAWAQNRRSDILYSGEF